MYKILIALIIFTFLGCNKIGEDDPKISFRSRDKRLIGKWEVSRIYFYCDSPSGNNSLNGYPFHYKIELENSGKCFLLDSLAKRIQYLRNWRWAASDQDFKRKERIVFNNEGIPWIDVHILEELRFKEMRTREYFDLSDFKRYHVYTWKRIKD